MAKLISFNIKLRGRTTLIATLRDAQAMAKTLLAKQFERDPDLAQVSAMIDQAIAGHHSPSSAFDAFARFAYDRGIAAPKDKSAAWKEFARAVGLRDDA